MMNDRWPKSSKILLVEDNPADVRLIQETLRESDINVRLVVASDGDVALRILREGNGGAAGPLPDIILLDLNMPGNDGRELLAVIKKDRNFRQIPVIVLTTSSSEQDISRAYDLGANCYVTKPVDYDRFTYSVKNIQEFWLKTAKLPRSA